MAANSSSCSRVAPVRSSSWRCGSCPRDRHPMPSSLGLSASPRTLSPVGSSGRTALVSSGRLPRSSSRSVVIFASAGPMASVSHLQPPRRSVCSGSFASANTTSSVMPTPSLVGGVRSTRRSGRPSPSPSTKVVAPSGTGSVAASRRSGRPSPSLSTNRSESRRPWLDSIRPRNCPWQSRRSRWRSAGIVARTRASAARTVPQFSSSRRCSPGIDAIAVSALPRKPMQCDSTSERRLGKRGSRSTASVTTPE